MFLSDGDPSIIVVVDTFDPDVVDVVDVAAPEIVLLILVRDCFFSGKKFYGEKFLEKKVNVRNCFISYYISVVGVGFCWC